ncbi:mrna (guanine-7-)methyltransferase [Anopheles darlingi]|uniref:mRNA cap guanine-N(7) methyltransferase n=1 Tax=Anopheles darlingi TaxID=43151 RepID=W5JGT1_ANODA|nr:mRNA cap guanine-N7 methyltransferase [Anopheles darlingi]ETN62115.1 mrna (guanine-7-)methyltransferase [Anopheles darlingi]
MGSDLDDSSESGTEMSNESTEPKNKEQPEQGAHSEIVASHYNKLEDRGLFARKKSNIFHLRNFNNWIKSVVIEEYSNLIKQRIPLGSPFRVLDMCCGKGGDLMKWISAKATHLICTDIAQVSLEHCESRYNSTNNPEKERRKVEFFAADATLQQLRTKYKDPSMRLHLVSCQFAFHYSFESYKQADCMFKNAAECLDEGFYFIGTIPDANEIMKRQRLAMADSFGNDIYNITFQCDPNNPPLFGAKYNFQLDEVVNCPEFLVHFPTFEKLALKHGLRLREKKRFDEIFDKYKVPRKFLLERMQALETYPQSSGRGMQHNDGPRKDATQYRHAEEYERQLSANQFFRVGTLSQKEWEAATLYLFFAFEKMKTTYDAVGKPIYS